MDSETNIAVFHRVIDEVFNQGKFEILPELFEPDFIEHQFGLNATIPGMQSDIAWLREKFPDLHLTIEDIAAVGDTIWARITAIGTNTVGLMGPPNGRRFEIAVFDEVRLQNGKIVEHWGSPDRFAQLVQLGVI